MSLRPSLLAFAAAALLSACAAGPDYVRPALPVPDAYKEAGDWKPADPRPAASGLAWWRAYGDPVLDGLEADAGRANQDIRQAEATYRQARALADVDRAGLFPSIGLNAGAERARTNANGIHTGNAFSLGLAASWEPDLWGSVRRQVEAGNAGAQASADDLAAARLSIQTTLAQDYLQLRIADQQRDLYSATVEAYAKALRLTRAQHDAGVALQSDVALAEAQLAQAQAAAVELQATRAQLDAVHAQVSKWRRELTPAEWERLHVVIIGPHMPREDLVVTQYFLRLLHERKEGVRVVYAESLWQEPQAIDLLGTHLLDGSVGDAFFGDAMRMHRDLLADAAKKYLPKLR